MKSLRFLAVHFSVLSLVGCRSSTSVEKVVANPISNSKVTAPVLNFQYVDATQDAGLNFRHTNGAFGMQLMPESVGPGVAFFDYDGDGDQDIYCVNSRNWTEAEVKEYERSPWSPSEMRSFKNAHPDAPMRRMIPAKRSRQVVTGALFSNDGHGKFTNVTKRSGLEIPLFGMGAAVADYDNDGRDDLFVTGWDRNILFHNQGGGKFRDVTNAARVQSKGWGTSAMWFDYDKDGKLDLFVCNYIRWTPKTDVFYANDGLRKSYIGPRFYTGQDCQLLHNEGNGRFKDVSVQTGIKPPGALPRNDNKMNGKSLGVVLTDYNQDGWPDMVVANDMERNYLWVNQGGKKFVEQAREAGIAYNDKGETRAGMGVDTADIDGSGQDSVVIGHFSYEMLGLYKNSGGMFKDVAGEMGLAEASFRFLTFGIAFLDADNDGWLDIFVANGHVQDDIAKTSKLLTWEQHPLLFLNSGTGKFHEVSEQGGAGLAKKVVARGMAYADIDSDGDLDVAIAPNSGRTLLLRNEPLHNKGAWKNNAVRIILQGTKSNRNGIGARLETRIGSQILRRVVRSGSSYCSANELPVTFGLAKSSAIEELTISWPSGITTKLKNVPASKAITIREGIGITRSVPLNP